jgi:ferritin-like protein
MNIEINSSIWREEIQNRTRLLDFRFGGKKFKIEIDSSIWREEIQNRNQLLDLAGRNSK